MCFESEEHWHNGIATDHLEDYLMARFFSGTVYCQVSLIKIRFENAKHYLAERGFDHSSVL